MLLHIPQVLTPAEVAAFRERLDAAPWVDGRQTVGAQGAQVKHNRQLDAASPAARELSQAVTAALLRQPLFVSAALPRHVLPPFFNRYGGGEHYGDHIDGAIRFLPDSGQPMRTDLSATLFLAEPEAYDGGDLVVRDTYGEHLVKLPAGDLILYPSTSLHRVEPVTRGERVAAFLWLQSMVRDDGQRTQLYELDQAIQALRARVGDAPELVTLTGLYHNLMRRWVEV
jgi:PKHD-type hydroxylase